MKAVLFYHHGGPEVLQYCDFPTPEPKLGEVIVKLHAAALNRMDITVRNGWQGLKLELPHINGADGAGGVSVCMEVVGGGADVCVCGGGRRVCVGGWGGEGQACVWG